MKNNETIKKKSMLVFFLKMILILAVIDLITITFANLITTSSFLYKYGTDLITEVFYALLILIVMLLFHNSYVFTDKKAKFWDSIKLATPMLIISLINLFVNISEIKNGTLFGFINVFVFCIFIGIAEEFLCRGWIQNEFIERFSDSKKSVINSILLASLVFGLMHIVNLGFQTFFETLLQIINATALGFLLGSVYYKTKNIWSVIFLHSFYDFAIFLGEMNQIKDCTYNTPTIGVTLVSGYGIILISAIWILSAILVLKKCNFPDSKAKNEKNLTIKLLIVLSFVLMMIPLEKLVPEYDDYEVCYTYEKLGAVDDYELHFPQHDLYVIDGIKKTDVFDTTSNVMKEKVEEDNYSYTFMIDKDKKVKISNNIVGNDIVLDFENVVWMAVLENDITYSVVIMTNENESTIYYSDFISKDNIQTNTEYMEKFKDSFKKFELPEVSNIGYITLDDSNYKYPLMVSRNYDYFIVKNSELYLISLKK